MTDNNSDAPGGIHCLNVRVGTPLCRDFAVTFTRKNARKKALERLSRAIRIPLSTQSN